MPLDVLDLAVRARFPPPWTVGWNRYEGVVQIEVNLPRAFGCRRHRGTGSTWAEALEAMR